MLNVVSMLERIRILLWIIIIILAFAIAFLLTHAPDVRQVKTQPSRSKPDSLWRPPQFYTIADDTLGELIRYGRELIEHTAAFLGPNGRVSRVSNGMNCQNCHLDAGTKPFAANYSAVASTYPKFRSRSGTVEGLGKRVNDCIERSLNGTALLPGSRELNAIIAYLKWIGKDVPAGQKPPGSGLRELPFLPRPANPLTGQRNYLKYCSSCHGTNGRGLRKPGSPEWQYPPLWGPDSYNTGAGLYRLSRFAAFIKSNMPLGTTYANPVLTDEEAWDIAAYVNSMPRPHKDFPNDWPDLKSKPVDHPFGPYVDEYSEERHKYGPFAGLRKYE
jgi:thiosulfate dehydrogenase